VDKRLIPPSNNNNDASNKPVKKARIVGPSTLISLSPLSPRNPAATIGANYIRPPPLSELKSFIVEIYKEIGIDGSKSILAISSSMTTASSTTKMNHNQTTWALATRTRMTRTANYIRPDWNNNVDSTIPVELDFETIEASTLNMQAFNFNKHGAQQSSLAARKSKSHATSNIIDAVAKAGTKDQQALALSKACLHPSIVELTKIAGLAPSSTLEEQTCNLLLDQLKKTFKEVLGAGKRKRVNMDWLTFIKIL
jgi:hypothetical protein